MRRDSTAHAIAAQAAPRLGRIRVPAGASVRSFPIQRDPKTGAMSARGDAITAAAQVLASREVDRTIKRPPTERWQAEAWALRDEIGELRYIVDRQARGVAQARLFVGKAEGADATPTPSDDPMAVDLQAILFGSRAATEQMLKRCAQHLSFNGDSVLHAKQDGNRIALTARSVSELQGRPGDWSLNDGYGSPEKLAEEELLIRCWTPHPQWYGRADAPVRAVIPVARELRGLTQFVSAQIDSRLAGSGLLLLPQEIESMWSQGNDDIDGDAQTFAEELTEYFLTPIKDRDSAAAVVPFMATLPAEMIEKIKHITFDTPLDEHAADLRDESIRRIGLGMDSDPSILLGQGSSNHWSAWNVSANEIRFGIEPVVSVICHALTVGLLRPLMEQRGVPDPEKWQVWYDVSGLVVREDRSKDAQSLWDKELLSSDTVREENGFSDSDAPDSDEVVTRRLWELAKLRPDMAGQILPKLGIHLEPAAAPPAAPPTAPAATPTPPAPAPEAATAPEAPDGPPVLGETEATEDK